MAIDILESKVVGTNKETWYKLIGTKDDTKPTGEFPAGTGHTVAKDSTYFEMGTEIRYEFNGTVWNPKGQVPVTLIEKEITQNGIYSASDDDADGYSSVDVEVEINAGTKNITSNGTYKAVDDELEGYSEVTVDVAGADNNALHIYTGAPSFSYNDSLKSISIPDGYVTIIETTLQTKVQLKSIEIPSSISNIPSNAFNGCVRLETITINKAEGSIVGAPWGAPNATVVWTG